MKDMIDDSAGRGDGEPDLVALLGSRLCHDLISPIGAIGNGLELLEMSGRKGEEMNLIRGALEAAKARIDFFRMAFGAARAEHSVPAREMRDLLEAMYRDSRIKALWRDEESRPRTETRLASLAIACCEAAAPWGGTIEVVRNEAAWVLHVDAKRLKIDPELWQALGRGRMPVDLAGGEVQFGLLAREARALRRPITVSADERHLSLIV